MFPLDCVTHWQAAEAADALPAPLVDWLLDPGSLTERIKGCSRRFHVEPLGQEWMAVSQEEHRRLQAPRALVREVLLVSDGRPVVFARTLIPEAALVASGGQLAALGDTPLGALLFANPAVYRDRIEWGWFAPDSPVARLAARLGQPALPRLYGRRSCFFWAGQPLLVSEVFLPLADLYAPASG